MTIISALGFTLFGMIAGALLLVRFWVRSLHKPENVTKMLRDMSKAWRENPNVTACREHGCPICGPDKTCPCCGARLTIKEAPQAPLEETRT